MINTGDRIRGYTVGAKIGDGGECIAFQATKGKQEYVLRASIDRGSGQPEASEEPFIPFIGKKHRCIAGVVEVFKHGQTLVVVTEYAEGQPLDMILGKRKQLGEDEVKSIISQVLEALEFCHASVGMLHLDVKPDNIIGRKTKKRGWCIKLIDMGVAQKVSCNAPDKACGTPGFVAPELYFGAGVVLGPQADLFSTGVLAFVLLTGKFPIKCEPPKDYPKALLSQAIPRVRSICPNVAPQLDRFIFRLMAIQPGHRPISARIARMELLGGPQPARQGHPQQNKVNPRPKARNSVKPKPQARDPQLALCVVNGPHSGHTYLIPNSGLVLGRELLNPSDGTISRRHARADVKGDKIVLSDLQSKNQLIVNERRRKKVTLAPQGIVSIGGTRLLCCYVTVNP